MLSLKSLLSNLTPPASREKSAIFSTHDFNASLIYLVVAKRKCKRKVFLKFFMCSTYETCFNSYIQKTFPEAHTSFILEYKIAIEMP